MSTTEQDAGPSTATRAQAGVEEKKPVVILCIGMAGSVSSSLGTRGMTNMTGQDDLDATSELLSPYSEQASIHPQLGSGSGTYAIQRQYRYQGYGGLQGSNEAVGNPLHNDQTELMEGTS